jgi:uncharacterized protein involved in exopolysaccharide biosynthesis
MLEYDQTVDEAPGARSAPQGPTGSYLALLSQLSGLFARNTALILAVAALCAVAGFGVSKILTPRYTASVQIYVDPHGLPGVDKEGTPLAEDSNGFINFVESQSLVITSRIVLEHVVASEKLDRDDEFVGAPSLWTRFFGAPQARPTEDGVNAAVAALASRISVHRPERTFIIDLSVRSRDPEKAARLANAVANAFIEVQSTIRSDSARQTTTSLGARLETLRAELLTAEKKVEDFKAQNGLVGMRDQTVTEQQLRDMNQQITVARTRVEEARTRYDQIQAARGRGGDVGALAVGLNLPSLGALRAQQAEAQQKLADLSAELGPRHPLVKDAQARVNEANHAVDAELARFAQSVRNEYSRAKELEASLNRQLDSLKEQSLANDQTSVGLRDLQREAEAARNVYELFVTRSRQTGDIQQVDAHAPNMRIISMASPPKDRSFPPSASLLGGAGFVFGLIAGFAAAAFRERRYGAISTDEPRDALQRAPARAEVSEVAEPAPPKQTPAKQKAPLRLPFRALGRTRPARSAKPAVIAITERTWLECREQKQSVERIDLAGLGFATLQASSDRGEFRRVFETIGASKQSGAGGFERRCVAVAGANDTGLRSALAINLALTAAESGLRVALMDGATRNAKITRAVRDATGPRAVMRAMFFETVNKVLLVLPKGFDEGLGRLRPVEALAYLRGAAEENIDIVICDGPTVSEADAASMLEAADDIILVDADDLDAKATAERLGLGAAEAKLRAIVRFEEASEVRRKAG